MQLWVNLNIVQKGTHSVIYLSKSHTCQVGPNVQHWENALITAMRSASKLIPFGVRTAHCKVWRHSVFFRLSRTVYTGFQYPAMEMYPGCDSILKRLNKQNSNLKSEHFYFLVILFTKFVLLIKITLKKCTQFCPILKRNIEFLKSRNLDTTVEGVRFYSSRNALNLMT